MTELEITDKRKFNADGEAKEPIAIEEPDYRKLLGDIPCVFSDPRPRKGHVLIMQKAAETTYAGTKFIIPETSRQSPNEGVVVSVGAEVDPIGDCKPGDLVVFGRYNAEPVTIGEETYSLVQVADIKLVREVTYAIHAD